ncbi:MAG: magnesium transporter [Sphingobacteriales bacterium]|nr:magnesium transporter [Sphingobacteriales bacterium]
MKQRDDILFDLEKIEDLFEGPEQDLRAFLDELHPSEIAKILELIKEKKQLILISLLPIDIASEAISEMDPESHPEKLLEALNSELVTNIVEELSYDDATDIVSQLSEEKREEILDNIDKEDASEIRKLLTYNEETAGGLMSTEFIQIHRSLNKRDALEEVAHQSEETENFYAIYVVDNDEHLVGTVSLKNLIKAKPYTQIDELLDDELIFVYTDTDQEDVAQLLSQYNLPGIPVVDKTMHLLGVVSFDDVIDVLEEETTEDILKIANVSDEEELSGNWKDALKSRVPWLMVNMFTAFLASSVVYVFQPTIQKITLLATFMPIIAGMGGNAGTQALAVTIRRISLNTLPDSKVIGTIKKEVLVGLMNGLIFGTVVAVVASLNNHSPLLGLVVFLAMFGNLLIAGITGASVPIILEKLGFDPAVASSIILTAFTDTLGFLLILGIGSYFLL